MNAQTLAGDASRPTVMVVDDNDRFVKTITRFLEKACSVSVALTASSAEDAIERIGSAQPDFLLLDVQLPGISGIEAIPSLRENSPDTCIIMVTNTGPEYRDQALERGADAFISKSQVVQELPRLLTPKTVLLLNREPLDRGPETETK